MGKLLEVIRRLAIVITWFFGGGFALLVFNDYYDGHYQTGVRNTTELGIALGLLFATYIVHRVINWVLLKEDKPFQD